MSKLKVNDIDSKKKSIIFHEKNNKLITRNLLTSTFDTLITWIKKRNLKKDDYLFYKDLIESEQYKHDKKFSLKIKRMLM